MDKEEMMAAVGKSKGCCKKSESEKMSCKMPSAKHRDAAPKKKSCHNKEERKCGMQTESTCICICVFQYAAPDQLDNKFQISIIDVEQSLNMYLQQNWKDPQLALPWQPPDMMVC